MKSFVKYLPLLVLLNWPLAQNVFGQMLPPERINKTTRMLFVLDGSGSMMAKLGNETRWDIAKRTLIRLVDSLRDVPRLEVALRVYGHQSPSRMKNCKDSKLEVAFGPTSHDLIIQRLKTIKPQGETPIAYSLEQSINDFPTGATTRNVIVMITDGLESCNGDPCAISVGLQKKGIFLRPFIIGLGGERNWGDAFSCMGRYFDARSPGEFAGCLGEVMKQSLCKTTVSVELLDDDKQTREKDVNVSFINTVTRQSMYDLVHYRDGKGRTDTISIDAILTYDLMVYTLPMVVKKNVEIIGGRHNVIRIETPRGKLLISQKSYTDYSKELKALVRETGKPKTILAQQVAEPHDLLVGSYDAQVLTMPRTYFSNIKIEQGKTTTIVVPQPGMLTVLNKIEGFGSLYVLEEEGEEWIYNFPEQSIGRLNMALQPGSYKFVFRSKDAPASSYTKSFKFTITSGQTQSIDVFKLR